MLHVNVEELMKRGHSPEEIVKLVSDEIYSKAEQETARIAAENAKKAAAEKEKEALNNAKDAAITALINYIALISPRTAKEVDLTKVLNDSLDSVVEGLKLIDNLTIKYNGQTFSIFDL